jgi:hypothetical protein
MLPAYYLASRHTRIYIGLIAPGVALSVYCFIIQAYGSMDVGNEIVGFVMLGTLRAFAGLGVGCICSAMYNTLCTAEWSPRVTAVMGMVEGLCFLSLPCLILFCDSLAASDVLFWVLLFAVLVILCFTGKTPIVRVLNRHGVRIGSYLGRLSLYIYLFHWFFALLFVHYIPDLSYWTGQLAYCLCVITASMVMMRLFAKPGGKPLPLTTKI